MLHIYIFIDFLTFKEIGRKTRSFVVTWPKIIMHIVLHINIHIIAVVEKIFT